MKQLDITHKFEEGQYILYYCDNHKKLYELRSSRINKTIQIFRVNRINDIQSILDVKMYGFYSTESIYDDELNLPKLKFHKNDFERPLHYHFSVNQLLEKTGSFLLSEDEILMAIDAFNYNNTSEINPRLPKAIIPFIRRTFPQLIASELANVQPMTSPIGFLFNTNIKENYE